jgi:integrase
VLCIGADGDTKNSDSRDIQFNTELDKVANELLDMLPCDTEWLFPSPQRGKKDRHSKTFRESLRIVAKASGLEWVGFHHFRVYFASTAVMAGIDYMTIAEWLGHQDGGQLVAEVYGHLNDAHKKSAAKLLKF